MSGRLVVREHFDIALFADNGFLVRLQDDRVDQSVAHRDALPRAVLRLLNFLQTRVDFSTGDVDTCVDHIGRVLPSYAFRENVRVQSVFSGNASGRPCVCLQATIPVELC